MEQLRGSGRQQQLKPGLAGDCYFFDICDISMASLMLPLLNALDDDTRHISIDIGYYVTPHHHDAWLLHQVC
jgi:hypothetical protein